MASMAGRTVLVTGGTRGIGRATALGLARLGATVGIAGRHASRGAATAAEISALTGGTVEVFTADLSVQAEVRRLAAEVLDRLPHLDVLVNNAGGYWNTRQVTDDGIERTLAVNHLAPFLLTTLLLARLGSSRDARVVTVASHAHAQGRIDFDDLQGSSAYSGARAYDQSKLANVLFTYELARRMGPGALAANAVHPGVVSTALGAEDPGLTQRLLVPVLRPFMRSPARGAETSVHLASAPGLHGVTGHYFVDSRPRASSERSQDRAVAARLWQVSTDLVGGSGTGPY